ncbi:MAG: hypothetical protein ABR583_08910 [Gaiellaceae bacterium]
MRRATIVLSVLLVALGVAVVVRTALAGAGAEPAFGYVFGAALALAGAARLYLAIARRGA